ncbi:c-type cytochrome [Roseateles amylovorans]|uniref:C-type cytochrome n=1 Tax=Roseateles amylovorans TaxID=2978473 RepID=A0ABY6B6D8_9BURK|nr:c-type cytochrome [Roseateles amylovorans]UXH80739.1 c-type cytochrome [Roseateles amylovorans]
MPQTPDPPRRFGAAGALVAAVLLMVAVLVALGGAAFIWLGVYDVSATGPHLQPVHSMLEVALRQSVLQRADAHPPPSDLVTPARQQLGAACFRDRCVVCHGAPGVAPEPFALGMQPVPSSLIEGTRHWRHQDLYWITRNGIKMSGMPAWEYRLSEDELWAVVAFLDQLPRLTPPQYAALTAGAGPSCRAVNEAPAAVVPPLPTAELAQRAFRQHGCTACHIIPGVVGPDTSVGPVLTGLAGRDRIGGRVAATEQGLADWIRDPRSLDAHTAMPTVGISESQARLMARYLLMH